MEEGLAEVLVLRGEEVVLRVILLGVVVAAVRALDVVVEGVPVGVVEGGAARAQHLGQLRIVQPGLRLGRGQGGGHDLAALEELGAERGGLGVERLVDLLDVDILDIPVGRVALHDAAGAGLPVGQNEGAAVEDGVVAGAEVLAHHLAELAVAGHEADVGEHGLKVGDRLLERVLEGVIVKRLDADVLPFALAVEIRLGVLDDVEDVAGLGDLLQRAVEHAAGGVDKVVRDDLRAVFLHVGGHPLDARTQVERPGQAVLRALPALGQAGLQDAVVVVLHERVDEVGAGLVARLVHVVERSPVGGVDVVVDLGGGMRLARFGEGDAAQEHKGQRKQRTERSFHWESFLSGRKMALKLRRRREYRTSILFSWLEYQKRDKIAILCQNKFIFFCLFGASPKKLKRREACAQICRAFSKNRDGLQFLPCAI